MGSKDNGELFEENIRLKQSVTNIKRSLDAVSVESMDDIKALEIRQRGRCYKIKKFLMRPAFLLMVIALLIAGVAMYLMIVNYKTSKAGLKASNTAVAKAQVAAKNAKDAEATAAEAVASKAAENGPQGCGSGTKKTFPDIDYALFGYNILKGYPMAVGHDPGLTRPIFRADYNGKQHTADCKYTVPHGLTVVPDVSCVSSFTSEVIRDRYELTKSLDVSAEVSGGGWGAEFSASAQYKQKSNSVQSKESVFINSVAKCDYYLSIMDDMQPPPLDASFIMKVRTLKTVDDVFKFFEYYGTHYLKTVTFGARLIFESKMKKSDYSSMKSKNVNVAVSGSYSGIVRVSGKASLNSDEQKQANNFRKKTETKTISVGAPPPADGNTATWASEVKETPVPTKYKMGSIEDLFTKKFMGHLVNNTDDLYKLVKAGRKGYCRHLKKKGTVDSCKKIQSYVNFKDVAFEHTTWLKTFKGDHIGDCVKGCLRDKRCVATVYKRDGKRGNCYIYPAKHYNGEGVASKMVLFIDAIALSDKPTSMKGMYIIGDAERARYHKNMDKKKCKEHCLKDSVCVAFGLRKEAVKATGKTELVCKLYQQSAIGEYSMRYDADQQTYFEFPGYRADMETRKQGNKTKKGNKTISG